MNNRMKLLTAALTVAVALSLAAGSASANRSLSVVGSTTVTGNGVVTFLATGGGTEVQCPVTITKTISRVIPKILGTLLGAITRIVANRPEARCRTTQPLVRFEGVEILEIVEPRYRLFYEGFNGTLPIITGIRKRIRDLLIGFIVELFGARIRCLYEEEERRPGAAAIEELDERQVFVRTTIGENLAVLLRNAGRLERENCPREGTLRGAITNLGTPPTITLI